MTFVIGAERIPVGLEQRHVACPRHAEPFRADWPRGWARFAMTVAQLALDSPALQGGMSNPRFWTLRGLNWEDITRQSPDQVVALLGDRPACEWTEPHALLGAYRESGIGQIGLCRACGLFELGTPYSVRSGRGVEKLGHVGFRCVVAGVRLA